MSVSKLLKSLPGMSRQERRMVRARASNRLQCNPTDAAAHAVVRRIDELDPPTLRQHDRIQVGSIGWEPHGHARVSAGFVGNDVVARIHKCENHNSRNAEVYILVLSEEQIGKYRMVEEARAAAATAYHAKNLS